MKRVTIERKKTTTKTVASAVELPNYSKQDMMADDYDSVVYTRVSEDRIGIDLHVTTYPAWRGDETIVRYEIEAERNVMPYFADDEHMHGVAASSREEFLKVAREIADWLKVVISTVEMES